MIDERIDMYKNRRKIESQRRFIHEITSGEYKVYKTKNPWSKEWSNQPSIKNIRQLSSFINSSPIKEQIYEGLGKFYITYENDREIFMDEDVFEDLIKYKEITEMYKRKREVISEIIP